jgi:hypothetical protein
MAMMFVGGVVLMFDILILFLLYKIYRAGLFHSHPNPYRG